MKEITTIGINLAKNTFQVLGWENGREMAAQIGLVPKQHSSGDRQVLLCITQKGNRDLKQVLIHGARA